MVKRMTLDNAIHILFGFLLLNFLVDVVLYWNKYNAKKNPKMEIERKFLINSIPPEIALKKGKEVHQTYLAIGFEELRIRSIRDGDKKSYSMAKKKGKGLSREEIEFDIMEETYDQQLMQAKKIPLIKFRHSLVIDGRKFDLDVFQNSTFNNLITIEIEFNSIESANAFIPPTWFGLDVTSDVTYKNQSLWAEIQPNSKDHL
jgi:adenylate cyclase